MEVLDVKAESLRIHKKYKGELEVAGAIHIKDKKDLSILYTPGVSAPCLEIMKDKEKVYDYTLKSRSVAVISNGTAILGLGDIGPEAGLPVIEAKSLLHKEFASVDAFPIALDEKDPEKIVQIIKAISPGFGGIHLEDIKAPECFYIEDRLKEELDIPVYHDDQHGTAIAVLAGLYNALKIIGKELKDIKVLINGAGASGIATAKLLLAAGVNNIVLNDLNGALIEGDENLNEAQKEIAKYTNRDYEKGQLEDLIEGKDLFIGLSVGDIVTKEMVKSMNKNAMVFALANPNPEINPIEAKEAGARITATGRGDFDNQLNNLLAFPGIFRGALDARVTKITDNMKIAVAKAIAELVNESELKEEYIVPSVFDERLVKTVAEAVKANK
ncbi:MAG: NAD(P)-dependent malic enzyme [Sarcina sp.]